MDIPKGIRVGTPFCPFKIFNGVFIPEGLVLYKLLGPGEKLLLGRLYRYCGTKKHCFPSTEEMAEQIGVSERSVYGYLKSLEAQGFISVHRRGLQKTNIYVMLAHEELFVDNSDDDIMSIVASSEQDGFRSRSANIADQNQQRLRLLTKEEESHRKRVNIKPSPTPSQPPFGRGFIQETDSNLSSDSNTSESLDPDVTELETSEVQTLQEKNPPAPLGGAASVSRTLYDGWTFEARDLFRTRYKTLKKAKMNGGDALSVQRFFDRRGITPESALLAVEGFRSSAQHTLDLFLADFDQWEKRGQALQDASPPESVPNHKKAATDSPQVAETAKKPVSEILERWNLLVPSAPITDWNPKRDDETRLKALLRDPEFMAAFEGVCAKCEAMCQAGGRWTPHFRWMIEKKGKSENWWKIHTGGMDGFTKPEKKTGRSKVETDMDIALKQMLSTIGDK